MADDLEHACREHMETNNGIPGFGCQACRDKQASNKKLVQERRRKEAAKKAAEKRKG